VLEQRYHSFLVKMFINIDRHFDEERVIMMSLRHIFQLLFIRLISLTQLFSSCYSLD